MAQSDVLTKKERQKRLRNTKIISNQIFKGKAEIITVTKGNKIIRELRLK